ncbi:LysR family transcriptional regulator [Mycoavidus sp. B2-EB]|uniref:LysR family transcriptional regulator n=1 Tax=Mycoavidus sp. B2-EB TaxID=2651972 RepID=UPI0016260F9A|nr:LysR family transcriptional regulator [Mycoavidus sp. B2-EB]BBO59093.1 LysR family transcriptional regulator [Mycoavidus sp. B2-EB]
MNQLQAMRVFLQVTESGSFGRAATQLKLSNAVITRYVALLEAHLNTQLLQRTTRCLSLTEAGRAYADGCRHILAQVEAIEANATQMSSVPCGTLKIFASAALSLANLTPLLSTYRTRYPKVKLQLTLGHRPVDLIENGFDASLVATGSITSTSMTQHPLLTIESALVAAPSYLAQHGGTPHSLNALTQHTFAGPTQRTSSPTWTFVSSRESRQIAIEPAYLVNDLAKLREAALAGIGIAILPQTMVDKDLAKGKLKRILPEYSVPEANEQISLVYSSQRHLPAKTRAFVELATQLLASDTSHTR